MESPTSAKHERKWSIDNEPKTLLTEELDLAREEALKVINNHTEEEAKQIFLEGLEPVENAVDNEYVWNSNNKYVWDSDDDDYDYDYDDDDERRF